MPRQQPAAPAVSRCRASSRSPQSNQLRVGQHVGVVPAAGCQGCANFGFCEPIEIEQQRSGRVAQSLITSLESSLVGTSHISRAHTSAFAEYIRKATFGAPTLMSLTITCQCTSSCMHSCTHHSCTHSCIHSCQLTQGSVRCSSVLLHCQWDGRIL